MMGKNSVIKSERHGLLIRYLNDNPFLTDDDLAQLLGVSIQTVRLDRAELDIPEMRERVKKAARGAYQNLRAIEEHEVVGELVDLEIGLQGLSILTVGEEMTLRKTRVLDGQYLFAQANSLALALIDTEVALTGTSKVSFKRPVFRGEKVVARAVITRKKGNKYMVRVNSHVKDELVFQGKFLVFDLSEEVNRLENSH
ncbi:transcriptional regulator of sugar metabolism [Desulfoscipio gibsoniae DSM 7213]|uniref:Transcriptional regulator of sugar metabolism n=2 Tax=Desulfoscipio gibsoniae TaxID=102134 RepID=R4KHW6_9FIRM|nr:transcriptional regulator of sugar metabolism [Desulfoscipio gibsoniae DSM 7213]